MSKIISYAQNREDVILDLFFRGRKSGFYVDVGANHPLYDSVTKLFYDKGWHGINVEPSQKMFQLLSHDRPRDINLNIGLSDRAGKNMLREYEAPGYSTFAQEMKHEHSSKPRHDTVKYHDYEVEIDTLSSVLERLGVGSIQFLKVDVEGYEYAVLSGNDWKKYRPEIVCVEANHIYHDWRPLLEKHGYKEAFSDGLNAYYVAKEHEKLAEQFSYAELLLGPRVVPWVLQNELNELDEENYGLKTQLEDTQIQNEALLEEKAELQFELHHKRFRHQVRDLLRNLDHLILSRIDAVGRTPQVAIAEAPDVTALPANSTESELLAYARQLDLEAASQPPGLRVIFYRLLRGAYMLLRKIAKLAVRALRKIVRFITHLGKTNS